VIQPEDGGYRMRVEMLRQWIAERKPLSRVRYEIDLILPTAENLFQAGYTFYQGGQLDEAEQSLRQAVRLNPNHIKANLILTLILLDKGDTDEALKILEFIYEYSHEEVKHPLVRVLTIKAKETKDDDKQLAIYEKILKIDPMHPESLVECKRIYKNKSNIDVFSSMLLLMFLLCSFFLLAEKISYFLLKFVDSYKNILPLIIYELIVNNSKYLFAFLFVSMFVVMCYIGSNYSKYKNKIYTNIFGALYLVSSVLLLAEKILYFIFQLIEFCKNILPLSLYELIINHSTILFILLLILIWYAITIESNKKEKDDDKAKIVPYIFLTVFLLISIYLLAKKISYVLIQYIEFCKNILPLNIHELIINHSILMSFILILIFAIYLLYKAVNHKDEKNKLYSIFLLFCILLYSIFLLVETISYFLFELSEPFQKMLPLSISKLIMDNSIVLYFVLFILVSASIIYLLFKTLSKVIVK